jgi:hypothetical protein
MTLETKKLIVGALGFLFLCSLILVQWTEVVRREEEAGLRDVPIVVPASSVECVDCHKNENPGIIDHWSGSTHAQKGIGCYDCHRAESGDADAWTHHGKLIATIVTPHDCGRCHQDVAAEFAQSHHAKGGNILASLDNFRAETVEGGRVPFDPHAPTPGRDDFGKVNGLASAASGCQQCHGSKVAFRSRDGGRITVDDLRPGPDGKPTNLDAVARIVKDDDGKPLLDPGTWPNTGIGRLNFDGSRGSCSACHSRHDFSPRRARRPENCGKCHLGPDHPQKEIYEESKHGVAYRDLEDRMNLGSRSWVLGVDYNAAPTCATCHMSGHKNNEGRITHDPGQRISWTNRPPISQVMDTDVNHAVVQETDPVKRRALVTDTWQQKRKRMKDVCANCHTSDYVNGFYAQYDDIVHLYNEKFAKPGRAIMDALYANGLLSKTQFDESIEWTWFYLWHHEGRRARHGAAMMAPDYTHWHGMYEVAERFYEHLIPEARELIAAAGGEAGAAVARVVDEIMGRPEHTWSKQR